MKMKKDIKWLKAEVEKQDIVMGKGHIYTDDILYLIDQLDEPEVLTQEWIDKNVVHIRGLGDIIEAEAVENLLVPKQELPVIPQFVADWWEHGSVTMYGEVSIDKKSKLQLISNFNDRGLSDYLSKVEDWIDENESIFLDLVNGKAYEIEKEQKYYTLDSKNIPLLERWGNKIQRTTTELNIYVKGRDISRFELTEKEIKDYDERYWQFAVAVAE